MKIGGGYSCNCKLVYDNGDSVSNWNSKRTHVDCIVETEPLKGVNRGWLSGLMGGWVECAGGNTEGIEGSQTWMKDCVGKVDAMVIGGGRRKLIDGDAVVRH